MKGPQSNLSDCSKKSGPAKSLIKSGEQPTGKVFQSNGGKVTFQQSQKSWQASLKDV
jgi:hypothetical protein